MSGKGILLPKQHLQCCAPCLFASPLLWALSSATSSFAVEELLWLDDLIKALLLGNVSWGLSYSRNFGGHEHSALCYLMDPACVISGTQEAP